MKHITDDYVAGRESGADQSSNRGRLPQIHAHTKDLAACLAQVRAAIDHGHFRGGIVVEDFAALSDGNPSLVEVAG